MRAFKTEGIVLSTTDVFDTDRSLLLFTRELGKVRARARGVRKPTSRLTGHLLTFLPTQLELTQTGGGYLVTQAQVMGVDMAYPSDPLLFMRQAGIIAESMNRLFVDGETHTDMYDGLEYSLDRLRDLCGRSDVARARLVAAEFILKCLAELGYKPQLQEDVLSGGAVGADFIGWSSQLGGIMSKEQFDKHPGQAIRVEFPQTIVALRQLLRQQFVAERIGMPEEILVEVCQLAYDYAQTVIGQPLRSLAP